jgi:hypothetical protein
MIRDIILGMAGAIAATALIGYCQDADETARQGDKARAAAVARAAAHADEWRNLDADGRSAP